MGGCDPSRRPVTNSRNIPGSFEFCKAVRSGGPLPPLRRRISLVSFSCQPLIVLPDGTIKNIHTIAHPILDERGAVVAFVGASIDGTEHHRSQADLEKAFEEIK